MKLSYLAIILAGITLIGVSQTTGAKEQARAELMNPEGEHVGVVILRETPHGTLLHATIQNLPMGVHAFHVHAIGKCEPPFKSAGGHFNPAGEMHGISSAGGMHAGDMPNIHVPASSNLEIEILNTQIRLDSSLFDGDGAAIVIHAGADDYTSDPAGAAGPRIACGVIGR